MSNVQTYGAKRSVSLSSADWEFLDDRDRLSVSSLSSEESEAMIIFGEFQKRQQRLLSSSHVPDSDHESTSSLQHQSAPRESSLEQRLLDQIAKLSEDLAESQEQASLLMLQNSRIVGENSELKESLEQLLNSKGLVDPQLRKRALLTDGDVKKVLASAVAASLVYSLVKRKLVAGSLKVVGTLAFAGLSTVLWNWYENNRQAGDSKRIREEECRRPIPA